MPVITIDGPEIADLNRKRTLVREMTEAAERAFGLPKASIVVLLRENRPDNVGVGGELVADRKR